MRRLALVLLALSGCYGLAEGEAGVLVLPPAVDLTAGPFEHHVGEHRPAHPNAMKVGMFPPKVPGTSPPSFWSVDS